ncbi:hypothetical protein RI845_06760 [Thalassotalea nanhaiensis]|uniref:Glutamate--cysteine ligase n=1 Tax=Thalassotalea nanhaiensis TaxID=3065648 RepID=A0ABY9TMB1_9GAMM|nr:hypothetical protein RI845_06760 [Colwelliaceae bacterium SQ345]
MGRDIENIEYCQTDYDDFQQCLYHQLEQLKDVLAKPSFGQEPLKLGAELELYLVDEHAQVSLSNQLLLDQLQDEQFQHELNQYNLELNLSPVQQSGKPFSALQKEMLLKTEKLNEVAKQYNISVVPIGILPTLKQQHLNSEYMTDLGRYHCLSQQLYQRRGDDFSINISGEEPVSITVSDICAEGANTSFQVHMMTPFEKFNQVFNAAQLSLPLVTAIAANSPLFLGNRLWDETRIALFKQSIDIRQQKNPWQEPARVNFGFGWLRNNVWQLFAEAVSLYPPVLPTMISTKTNGSLPRLDELSLHMGTLWPWHRPVYDHHNNGHMRIEFRAIPAGPTHIDMLANAAFAIGLANGLANNIDEMTAVIPFRYAEYNFYRAAKHGLNAKILWPLKNKYHAEETAITDVIEALIPVAIKGLQDLNIDDDEITQFIGVIKQRLQHKITGAIWQKHTQKYYEKNLDKDSACKAVVKAYIENVKTGHPVSSWKLL